MQMPNKNPNFPKLSCTNFNKMKIKDENIKDRETKQNR